jgi:hypothetical protein
MAPTRARAALSTPAVSGNQSASRLLVPAKLALGHWHLLLLLLLLTLTMAAMSWLPLPLY